MTRIFRILRKRYAKTPFDGEGAYRFGGRWSSAGVRLAYTSEHLSLAMIEYFVHLDRDDPPKDLVVAAADVPDDVSRGYVALAKLPATWRLSPGPAELATIGDHFAHRRREAILVVPSALAPSEFNWLLNPDHPDFRRVRIHEPEAFSYDGRFFS